MTDYPPIGDDMLRNARGYEMDRVVVTEAGIVWGRMKTGEWRSLTGIPQKDWKQEAKRRFGPVPPGGGENARLIAAYHYAFIEGAKASAGT